MAALALFGTATGSATAQEIPDVPSLGFTIDPERGAVGDTVNGQVDPADIAEHCITDPEEFVLQFIDMEAANTYASTPYMRATGAYAATLPDPADVDPANLTAGGIATFFPIDLAQDLAGDEPAGLAESAMQATFIMAFADLATASPIAPYGNFDP